MYSPKINEDLIPVIYKLAKKEGKTMTRLLDEILRKELKKREGEVCRDRNKKEISKKKELTVEELKNFLKGKFIVLGCGHRFCLHPWSNTFIMTASGKTYCHNCY